MKMDNLEAINSVSEKSADASAFMVGTDEFAVPVGSLIDISAEIEKQEKELLHLEGFLTSIKKKLANENFVAHAPEAVIARERKKQRIRSRHLKLNKSKPNEVFPLSAMHILCLLFIGFV